jgi:zinc protease
MNVADTAQKVNAFRLKSNGLTVLLSERHTTPVVTTQIVYRVGSRNEAVGYTGSTHFLEHLMFKGTASHDPLKGTGIDDSLKPVGGFNNATTSYDRTSYFEIVPSNQVSLCLQLEADRMRHLLLRKSDRDAEMTVVRNELERGDDDPQELLQTNLFALGFKEHPYHHPIIGWRSDVENVPLARLRKFYDEFYWPNNAALILIGDFDSGKALLEIERLFGGIPRSSQPFPKVYTTEPAQEGERRFTVQRGSGLPRVIVGFHIPKCEDKDTYAIEVMEAILGDEGKKASRLYKRFMDSGLASDVSCGAFELRDPGMFTVQATPASGIQPAKIESLLNEEVDKLTKEPVSAEELDRAKKSLLKQLKLTVSDPMGLAEQLVETIAVADWKWLSTYPANIRKVTLDDIKRVASKYFTGNNRTVGYYLPKEKPNSAEEEQSEKSADASADAASKEPPEMDVAASLTDSKSAGAPAAPKMVPVSTDTHNRFSCQTKRLTFANGLTAIVMPIKGSGTVAVSVRSRAGNYFRNIDKTGVPDLVADLMTKGSRGLNKTRLAEELENMGTSMTFVCDNFWMGFNSEVASEDFSAFIPLAAKAMLHPTFPKDELARAKKLKLAALKQRMDDTGELAWNAFCLKMYKPGSVYWNKPFDKQVDETNAITRQDLISFHAQQVTPANTVFAIVGDVTLDQVIKAMQDNFGTWSGSAATPIKVGDDILLTQSKQELKINLPDKSNADAIIGHPIPVAQQSKDFFSTLIANAALGFDSFSTRLAPVRDKYGLTYGISSSFQDEFPYSPWSVSFSVNPANYERTKKLVTQIVDQYVKDGITQTEISHEKSHLKGAYFVGLRGPRQIASKLSEYELAGIGPEFIDNFGKNIDAVSITSANAAIRNYFQLNKALTVVCGSFKK